MTLIRETSLSALHVEGVERGNPGSMTETNLHVYNMPAGTFAGSSNLKSLRIKCGGRMAGAGIRNGRIRVYFGSTIVAEWTSMATSGWGIEVNIVRNFSDTSQRAVATEWISTHGGGGVPFPAPGEVLVTQTTPSEDTTSNILIRVTGQNLTDTSGGTVSNFFCLSNYCNLNLLIFRLL